MTKEKTWEERFDDEFDFTCFTHYDELGHSILIKRFIKQEQLKLIEEIEEAVVVEELNNAIKKEEEFLNENNAYLTGCKEGWNNQRQEVITALKTIKDKYK